MTDLVQSLLEELTQNDTCAEKEWNERELKEMNEREEAWRKKTMEREQEAQKMAWKEEEGNRQDKENQMLSDAWIFYIVCFIVFDIRYSTHPFSFVCLVLYLIFQSLLMSRLAAYVQALALLGLCPSGWLLPIIFIIFGFRLVDVHHHNNILE